MHYPFPRRRVTVISLIVLGAVLTYVIAIGVVVYLRGAGNAFVRQNVNILPYPAAAAGTEVIRYSNFQDFRGALSTYFTALKQFNPDFEVPSDSQVSATALDELVRQTALQRAGAKYSITVSSLEADEQVKKLVEQAGTQADVEQSISQLYGWDLATYRENIIVPYLLRQHVQEALADDATLATNQQAKERADAALVELKGGAAFADVAKRESEDLDTRDAGGSVGYIRRGDRDAAYEDAAFNLEEGTYSDVVHVDGGYAIIRVDDIREVADATDAETAVEERQVSHILFRTEDIDAYLTEQLRAQRIFLFVPGVEWDSAKGSVTVG